VSDRLVSRSALHGVALPGRFGKGDGPPGVTLSERVDLGLAVVAARKGRREALAAAVRAAYGVDLPADSSVASGPAVAFMGMAPGQWFAVSETLANGALADDLAERLKGLASVTDQSDGRAVVRIAGPRARDVLAKGLPIDLHPKVFRPGSAATSTASHMGVQIWQVDDAPTYDIAVFRGFAESFWSWATSSAAEFGYIVLPSGRGS
jgi:heterotetrameric sarcosine oxidase gamma subunit